VNLTTVTPYPLGTSAVRTLNLNLTKKTLTYITVASHIKGPSTIAGEPNPWISQWVNVTVALWATIKYDIAGSNITRDMISVLPAYATIPVFVQSEDPTPDLKVDGKDIAFAAMAFGTVPGDPRWSTVADVDRNYRVDGKDIALIALNFGY
jgi:hypothetical protein